MAYDLLEQKSDIQKRDRIVLLVDSLLLRAIEFRASDIHLEPSPKTFRVRYRIDGILHDQDSLSIDQGPYVISRLKVLSMLDIAQRNLPQDGKLLIRLNSRDIDLRISTFPSIHGEKMVIRILDRSCRSFSLEDLGCSEEVLKSLYSLLDRPHGFFLVTGPTGSGKTTTLYALLSKLNTRERHIITMEDPVEYQIDGITQSQVNEKSGFTFEKGIRSLLRQDPDVAMIGEIRDCESARIAIKAAMTGHLVLSTLHTNDSFGAVTRLIDMGVEPFFVSACLTGVLAQRLVRRLCPFCKQKVGAPPGFSLDFMWKSCGCSKCFGSGYRGRIGVFEFLHFDEQMRRLIAQGSSCSKLQSYAVSRGMSLLLTDGFAKIEQSLVSLDELARVVEVSEQ